MKSDVSDLFSEGMGVEATYKHEVGKIVPKIGIVFKNSQKKFNAKRDESLKNGSFKLAYPDEEAVEVIKRGPKKVDLNNLSAFVTNRN